MRDPAVYLDAATRIERGGWWRGPKHDDLERADRECAAIAIACAARDLGYGPDELDYQYDFLDFLGLEHELTVLFNWNDRQENMEAVTSKLREYAANG